MTTDPTNPDDSPQSPLTLSDAALIRAGADGELSDADQARLDALISAQSDIPSRIEFERQLRAACARGMAGVSPPASLRSRIESQITQQRDEDTEQETLAESLHTRATQTRTRSFWQRVTPSTRALAAAILLLVGGAFLYRVFTISSGSLSPAMAQHVTEIASFVGNEHTRCIIDPTRQSKFTIHELDDTPQEFAQIIGTSPAFPDLIALGLRFRDGGQCDVPGQGPSMHLRFDVVADPDRTVSLFIQRVADQSDEIFKPGKSYQLTSSSERTIYAWTADGLNYFLVSNSKALVESYRIASGLPKPIPGN